MTAFRSQVAQKHSSAVRTAVKTAETVAKAVAEKNGEGQWSPWSDSRSAIEFQRQKAILEYSYPITRG